MSRSPRSASPTSRRAPHGGEGQVRIIGGRWRNTRLAVPAITGLRPTSDRVRETLFNWLQPRLPGARVLDLFAGSGALGLEAVSRGAASALLVERDPELVARLRTQVAKLDAATQLQVLQQDALQWLQRPVPMPFDIVFLDPPFADGVWQQVLQHLPAVMTDAAWLYLESPLPGIVPPGQWQLHREGRTREVHYALYRRATATLRHDLNPVAPA